MFNNSKSKYFERYEFILVIFVILSVFTAYYKVLGAEFVYDDFGFIVNNKDVQSFRPFSKFLLSPTIFTGSNNPNSDGNTWRPIPSLAFALEYRFFGLNPTGFHLLSILLHLFNLVLIYILVLKLTGRFNIALLISALWALHPTLTEAISWVSNQSTLLFFAFFLLSLICFLKSKTDVNKKIWFWASYLFFGFSLLSKETALGGILVMALISVIHIKQNKEKSFVRRFAFDLAPYFLMGIFYLAARYQILGAVGDHALRGSFWHNLLLVPTLFFKYLYLVVWPVNLLVNYDNFPLPSGFFDPRIILGTLFFAIFSVSFWIGYRKSFLNFSFGIAWFVAFLLPVMQIIPFHDIVGERFLYAPLVGFFLALVLAFDLIISYVKDQFNINLNRLGLVAFVLVLSIFFVLTFNRNNDWLNSERLWLSVIKIDGSNLKAYVNLTAYYLGIGDVDKLVEYSERYLKINPDNKIVRLHLSLGHIMQGKLKEAKAELIALLQEYPDYKPALNNLSQLYKDSASFNKDPFVESTVAAPPVEGNIVNSGIAGRVILPDGKPFMAMLDIFNSDDMSKPFISVIAKEDGTIQIPLKPGSYVVKPLDPDGPHAPTRDSYEVNIGSGQWVQVKIEYK